MDLPLECFTSYCFNKKVYTKGWQFCCHLITSRNVKGLSWENVLLILVLVYTIRDGSSTAT